MITSSYSNGWSRSGPTGWPLAGFGGKAQASEFTGVSKPVGVQVAGSLLGGSMEKLLSAHLNA